LARHKESLRLLPGSETEPSATVWLCKIAEGDLASFHSFYRRFAPGLLSYTRQLCRDAVLAEDMVQEVFVTVWRKAASFRPDRGDPAGWLYSIARNKLIDHWRRSGTGNELGTMDFEQLPARGEHGEHGKDLLLTLRKALSRVPPEQRQAIELAYFGGLTYEETAKELKLPLGTLKSRIRIGLRNMRAVLEAG
jgi:RNA polymerase sigma-70 factor (ECF subfamily)